MRKLISDTVGIKIGTSSLTYDNGKMNYRRIEKLVMVLSDLQNQGKKVVMLTGDNKNAAEFMGNQAGVDEIYADLLPADKERIIQELKSAGHKVAFFGDGINDAPALTQADIGCAIGSGSDIAIESADIISASKR